MYNLIMQEFEKDAEISCRVADNIKKLRKQKGWSQVYLADLIVRSRSHINRIETGKDTTGLHTLVRIAKIFDITLDELVYG